MSAIPPPRKRKQPDPAEQDVDEEHTTTTTTTTLADLPPDPGDEDEALARRLQAEEDARENEALWSWARVPIEMKKLIDATRRAHNQFYQHFFTFDAFEKEKLRVYFQLVFPDQSTQRMARTDMAYQLAKGYSEYGYYDNNPSKKIRIPLPYGPMTEAQTQFLGNQRFIEIYKNEVESDFT